MKDGKYGFPSKKKIEESIRVIEDFRSVCKHQIDLGYWATVDFPSKHHINKILQLQYIGKEDVIDCYGSGLAHAIFNMIGICKAYVSFLRDDYDRLEDKK